MNWWRNQYYRMRRYSPWLGSGIALGVGVVYASWWWVAVLGVVLWVHAYAAAPRRRTRYLGAWLAGTVKMVIVLSWVTSVYPLEWLGVPAGPLQLFVIATYWLSAAAVIGAGSVVTAAVLDVLRSWHRKLLVYPLALLPVAWLLGELAGSVFFSLLTLGPGSGLSAEFSLGYVGYSLAAHPWLLQVAQWGGVYILSFLAVSLAVYWWLILVLGSRPVLFGTTVVAGLIVISATLPGPTGSGSPVAPVLTIDTSFPNQLVATPEGRAQRQALLYDAVAAALATSSAYLLLPEDARLFDYHLPPAAAAVAAQFRLPAVQTTIIDTGTIASSTSRHLAARVYQADPARIKETSKQYLVPHGEYLPYLHGALLQLIGATAVRDQFRGAQAYQPGPLAADWPTGLPAVLFCFESVSPVGVAKLMAEQPDTPFIVHPVSHGWFQGSNTLNQQLTAALQVQAVWSGRAIVSAGNQVPGSLITPTGQVLEPEVLQTGEWWQLRRSLVPLAAAQ